MLLCAKLESDWKYSKEQKNKESWALNLKITENVTSIYASRV